MLSIYMNNRLCKKNARKLQPPYIRRLCLQWREWLSMKKKKTNKILTAGLPYFYTTFLFLFLKVHAVVSINKYMPIGHWSNK